MRKPYNPGYNNNYDLKILTICLLLHTCTSNLYGIEEYVFLSTFYSEETENCK